jgi:hypothetical protein
MLVFFGHTTVQHRGPRRRASLLCVLAALAGLASPPVWGHGLTIQRIRVFPQRAVYYLNSHMQIHLNPSARHALKIGIPIVLKIEIVIDRHNAWFWQGPIAHLNQRFSIRDHLVSGQIVIRDLNSGTRIYFRKIETALHAIEVIRHIPVIDSSLLKANHVYRVRVKAVLDIKNIPSNLKWIAWIWSSWRTTSRAYSVLIRP